MRVYELTYKMYYHEVDDYGAIYCVARNSNRAKRLVAKAYSDSKPEDPEEFWAGDWLYVLRDIRCLGAVREEIEPGVLDDKAEAYHLCGRRPETVKEYIEIHPEVGYVKLDEQLCEFLEKIRRQVSPPEGGVN